MDRCAQLAVDPASQARGRPHAVLELAALLIVAAGCTTESTECAVQVAKQPLTNGTEHAEYLELEPWEEAAVVELLVDGEPQCSGSLVAERTVLTAKHCIGEASDAGSLSIDVRFESGDDTFLTSASVVAAHPAADVLVLEVEDDPSASLDVGPVAVARALPKGLEPNSLVQLAGFGGDGSGARDRDFVVEQVQRLREDEIVVSAGGLAGACFGDSGGPLLIRGDDGRARTLGILASGSAGCFGRDTYTRIDSLSDWLASVSDAPIFEPQQSADRSFEALGKQGRCFDAKAVWTEQGRIRSRACAPDRGCGWDARAEGYRCVPEAGACAGVSDLGQCDRGAAVRCVGGQVERNPCAACGFSCAHSPQTGAAICTASQPPDGG